MPYISKDELKEVVEIIMSKRAYPLERIVALISLINDGYGDITELSDLSGIADWLNAMKDQYSLGRALAIAVEEVIINNDGDIDICDDCGCYFDRAESGAYLDKYERVVCEYCLDNYCKCENCDDYFTPDDIVTVHTISGYSESWCTCCASCASNEVYRCNGCGEYFEGYDALDMNGYCEDCRDDEGDNEDGYLLDYSYKPTPIFLGDADDAYYCGVELEMDYGNRKRSTIQDISDTSAYIYMKEDGSLNDGIEIVSHPATLEYHVGRMPWQKIMAIALENDWRSHDTNTCGLHIHVSRKFFGDTEEKQDLSIAKLILLNNRFWDSHITKIARRTESSYAKRNVCFDSATTKETIRTLCDKMKNNTLSRYQAINLQNRNTVEFRMYKGTLNYNTFIATLQFTKLLCEAAKRIPLREYNTITFDEILGDNIPAELATYLTERRVEFDPSLVHTVLKDAVVDKKYLDTSASDVDESKLKDPKYIIIQV